MCVLYNSWMPASIVLYQFLWLQNFEIIKLNRLVAPKEKNKGRGRGSCERCRVVIIETKTETCVSAIITRRRLPTYTCLQLATTYIQTTCHERNFFSLFNLLPFYFILFITTSFIILDLSQIFNFLQLSSPTCHNFTPN